MQLSARLRPDAARPRLRQLRGPRGRATSAAPAPGSSRSATGAPAASSCCSSARPTRPTTTSSPTGCPSSCRRRASRSTSPGACTGRVSDLPATELARVQQTRRGHGYSAAPPRPGQQQLHVDFAGPALQALPAGAAVEAVVSGNANAGALRANAYPNRERGGWRVTRRFRAHGQPAAGRTALAVAPGRQAAFRNLGLCPCPRSDTMNPADAPFGARGATAPPVRRARCRPSPGSACGAACSSRCGRACTSCAQVDAQAPWQRAAQRRRRVLLALVAALAGTALALQWPSASAG